MSGGYRADCVHDLQPARVTTFPAGHPMAGTWLTLECAYCNAGTWSPLDRSGDGSAEILAMLAALKVAEP